MRAITSSRADNFSIGELSKQSGVNIETIRYYERIKMLPAPPRSANGRRISPQSGQGHSSGGTSWTTRLRGRLAGKGLRP